MANDALTTTSGTGSQGITQSPQSAVQPSTGTKSSSVQPGTANALLNSGQGGVALRPTALSTVSLSGTATSTTVAEPVIIPKHHANPVIFGFSALLFVVAVVLFWATSRSVKSTTHY